MVDEELELELEGDEGLPAKAIIATAIAAGVVAFMIRRARKANEIEIHGPADVAALAWQRAQDADLGSKAASATRDFVSDRVMPELKPVLLDLLKDLRGYVDQGFKRAEKTIKEL